MAKFKLLFKVSVKKDLRKIPADHVTAILKVFDQIAADPFCSAAKKINWAKPLPSTGWQV